MQGGKREFSSAEGMPILDILFDHYAEYQGNDDEQVERAYRDFCHSMLDVDPELADEIISTAAVLCMEYERVGFIAGFKASNQLRNELGE